MGGDLEFNFSIDGYPTSFLLLPYIVANLPQQFRNKWTFRPYLPGSGGCVRKFSMENITIDTDNLYVSVKRGKDKTVNLRFYAKLWESMNEIDCLLPFTLLLNMSIGEALSHLYVASVEKATKFTNDMIPLTKLEQWLLKKVCKNGEIPDPAMQLILYKGNPDHSNKLRHDIVIGGANYMPLLSEYYSCQSEAYESFISFGVKPIYIFYHHGETNLKTAVLRRQALADKLISDVLGERGTGNEIGIFIGGATGLQRNYIDLLLFDERAFMEKANSFFSTMPMTVSYKDFNSFRKTSQICGLQVTTNV
jgi:hypothetical protein